VVVVVVVVVGQFSAGAPIAASFPSTVTLTAGCAGKPLLVYDGCHGFSVYLTSLLVLVLLSLLLLILV